MPLKPSINYNDSAIELSEPLKDVEKQMNQIKMAVLLSQQAVKEAENKKNELVMYLAHDIRTPLTSIIGYLSLLDEAPDMPMEQKSKYVGITLKKAIRLEKLINEFFEIARYNTHQIKLEKTNVDLYYMLVQLIDEFYPVLSAKGNFAILQADEMLSVYGDSEKLARVFNNILKMRLHIPALIRKFLLRQNSNRIKSLLHLLIMEVQFRLISYLLFLKNLTVWMMPVNQILVVPGLVYLLQMKLFVYMAEKFPQIVKTIWLPLQYHYLLIFRKYQWVVRIILENILFILKYQTSCSVK